jgi:hypothetical protein
MKRQLAGLAFCAGLLVFASSALAGTPNTTAAGAVSYEVGAGWVTDGVDESSQNRWFVFTELAGRSYCVEAALGPATYFPLDPNLTLYSDSAGTVVYLSNTDGVGEPPQYRGSRICYQSALALATTFARPIKVNVPITAGSGDSGFMRVRVIDTTLVFPAVWFLNDSTGAAKYTVSLHVSNTTALDINGTFFLPGYGALRTFSGNSRFRAPDQPTNKGYADFTLSPPGGLVNWKWQGVGYLMHDGPPGALEAWADTQDPGAGLNAPAIRVFAAPR